MNGSVSISVVIPVHNGAQTIAATLDSIQRQSSAPERVLVVDDHSTDDTVSVVGNHPLGSELIELPANRGVAVARNRGLSEVDTSHVAILDQDDLWHVDRVALVRRHLAGNPGHGVLLADEQAFATASDRPALEAMDHPFLPMVSSWVDDDGETELTRSPWPSEKARPAVEVVAPRRVLAAPVTVTTSYVFERRTLLEAGGFASWLRSADDWISLQSLSRLTEIARVHGPGVFYRVHPANTSLSTDWSVPLLLANAAVRNGGNVSPGSGSEEPVGEGRLADSPFLVKLMVDHIHAAGRRGLGDGLALARFLAVDTADHAEVRKRLIRAWLGASLRGLPGGSRAHRIATAGGRRHT